jgi:hypothetical protein
MRNIKLAISTITISLVMGFIGAEAASRILEPEEGADVRLEREMARASKKWCPPARVSEGGQQLSAASETGSS